MAKRNTETQERGERRSTTGEAPVRRSTMGMTPFRVLPFGLLRRFANEIDGLFDDVGFGPTLLGGRNWPLIDVFDRDGQTVVRADIPGLKKDDIQVEVVEDELRITGERKDEREQREGEFYRAERSYGRFERRIPLPEGVNPDDISCTFTDGVLEVRMKAPVLQERRGRRLEIKEGGKEEKAA